jgi:D-aminopeptidase
MIRTPTATLVLALALPALAAEPRGRDLGIPFAFGTPGKWNAITDVPGVEVGHTTLIEGDSVRTGVTAILPRGKGRAGLQRCFAGASVLNGAGDMTGTHWVEESGLLDGPIVITDTNNVGVVRDAVIRYAAEHFGPVALPDGDEEEAWSLPVVAETWSGDLNPLYSQPIVPAHVFHALDACSSGPVAEGSVGGGTGMRAFGFKSGIGTSSRILARADGGFSVGVLVQSNVYGEGTRLLQIAGVPVGLELLAGSRPRSAKDGSIIVVVATDAPLMPHQLKRLARRAGLGLARAGGIGADDSGDIFIAFSTANPRAGQRTGTVSLEMLPNNRMDPLFEATIGATEEAIINALVAARTMTGPRGKTFPALPINEVLAILKRHGRLAE